MAKSIKSLSTIAYVKCVVCGKGNFTEDNPPVSYLGQTDHLACFAKDFKKKFLKKNPDLVNAGHGALERVPVKNLPGVNGLWASLVCWGSPDDMDNIKADILQANSKKQLEDQLADQLHKHKDTAFKIVAIFSKGVRVDYEMRVTVHITETT